jgi:muramoyltetrapeptide carboxypeptidase
VNTNGKILFLEEVSEDLYRLDRMMLTLKRAGKLENLVGLIVGGLVDMSSGNQDYGKLAEEIILDAVGAHNYPVVFDFPAGHFRENYPLIMGRKVVLNVSESVTVDFELNG